MDSWFWIVIGLFTMGMAFISLGGGSTAPYDNDNEGFFDSYEPSDPDIKKALEEDINSKVSKGD